MSRPLLELADLIRTAGTAFIERDLNPGPPTFLGSPHPQDAVFRVLDQIGGQLAHYQRDFLHGPLIEADCRAHGPSRKPGCAEIPNI